MRDIIITIMQPATLFAQPCRDIVVDIHSIDLHMGICVGGIPKLNPQPTSLNKSR